ncbi:MAG: hypothetical protein A2Y81_04320 [Nitrospirae bacterium RBG_13_43_8]|nr:MAG: hypothetical protein A2Y81_04320 [Nitrospirae bacterium RBG_13_43_8]
MRKTKTVISFVVIVVAILFAGNYDVYAGAGVPNPWGILPAPKGSTSWTGTLVITGQIANVSGLTAGLPADAAPVPLPPTTGYKDQIIKIEFFVRLENSKRGYATFSGLAKYEEVGKEYYLFYALGDYANGRIGEALNKFLNDKVYPNLPGGPYNGVLTGVTDDVTNVDIQLQVVDLQTGKQNLQAETPLYFNAKITVATTPQ